MNELDEIINEFLVESYENLDQLDRDLISLEDAPGDRHRLSSVFRTIHTIKGMCGFLGFPILEHVTHVGESLLVRLRDGELCLDASITNGLLAMVDAVRTMLTNIASTKSEGADQYESLVEVLDQLRLGQVAQPVAASVGSVASTPGGSGLSESGVDDGSDSFGVEERVAATVDDLEALVADLTESPGTVSKPKRVRKSAVPKPKAATKPKSRAKNPSSPAPLPAKSGRVEKIAKPKAKPQAKAAAKTPKRAAPKTLVPLIPVAAEAQAIVPVEEAPPAVIAAPMASIMAEPVPVIASAAVNPTSAATVAHNRADGEFEPAAESGDKVLAETTVRLDVALLDRLMNLVGELVLARNQIVQFSHTHQDASFIAAAQRLNLITTELQEGVLKTRMQPIRNAWNKLPRIIRDLSMSCGKKVNVEMEGADTELDKTILEAIKDPLTHIVRNSVDHGIEPPEVRVANGKPAEGTLYLRSFHEGGQVIIEIADDGGGIHLDRVRAKAIEKNLITAEQAAAMTDRETMNLILLPGFSTAAKVTNVSGRGVGMDVVKTNVERIGGTLDINSIQGRGTTLRITIPLTLAIAPALTVLSGGQRYCIPQVNLLELVRLGGDRVQKEIEQIHSVPVFRLRGELLPLLYLDEQLQLRPKRTHAERLSEEVAHIVVLQAEDRQFGLIVDSITDTQEIVVKPLGQHLKSIRAYAGSTIMGDGTISLILDVVGLAQTGQVLNELRDYSKASDSGQAAVQNDSQSWLVVDPGDGSQSAIELGTVARLEEFALSMVERSGQSEVVQYRGQIMPLLRLVGGAAYGNEWSEASTNSTAKESLSVVVYHYDEKPVGIVVGQIVDIVEQALQTDGNAWSQSQIINGRVTNIIDLGALVCTAV